MSSRNALVREMMLLAFILGGGFVLVVGFVLLVGGAFSPLSFARALLVGGLIILVVEVFLVQRIWRVNHVRGPFATWRREDRTQGCSIALLSALIALGLLLCGGLMEWWIEFR